MFDWLRKKSRGIAEQRYKRERDETVQVLESIPELEPLGWDVDHKLMVRGIDAEWLVNRLADSQGCELSTNEGSLGISDLASDLYEAGLETEQLAWIWGEVSTYRLQEALEQALAEVGITPLPVEHLRTVCLYQAVRALIEGKTVLTDLTRSFYSCSHDLDDYDMEYKEHRFLIYRLEEYIDRRLDEEVIRTRIAVLPNLEKRYQMIIEDAKLHLNKSSG